ncbi:hypothetical protein ACIO3O_37375 [Streptomyces sp. NPDC087440]|uniref:hypothetical protein n=1 Tax=Streptomyces sp. NPDC087440 TaxID=3365790 RepID=UPI00380F39BC
MTIAPPVAISRRPNGQEPLLAWLAPEPPTELKATPAPPTPIKPRRDLSHKWVVAAEVQVTPRIAGVADSRGSFKSVEGQRIDALEVYCSGCRRPYDEAKGTDCAAKIDNRHLIGGDQATRAKRNVPVPPPNARIIPGGNVQRRGLTAYVSGVSRTR